MRVAFFFSILQPRIITYVYHKTLQRKKLLQSDRDGQNCVGSRNGSQLAKATSEVREQRKASGELLSASQMETSSEAKHNC